MNPWFAEGFVFSLLRNATPFLPEHRPYWREHLISRLQGASGGGATLACTRPPTCLSPAPAKVSAIEFLFLELNASGMMLK